MRNLSRVCVLLLIAVMVAGCSSGAGVRNAALNPVTIRPADVHEPVVLVRDGKPAATIVIPTEDPEWQFGRVKKKVAYSAAKELAEHVKLATGATLPIVTEKENPKGTLILIGESLKTKARSISAVDLPPEGFRVKSFPGGVAIVGRLVEKDVSGGPKGTLFGVYDFLERFLGVRWYYPGPDGRVVPKRRNLVIPPVHYTDYPVRTKRTMHSWFLKKPMPNVTGMDFIYNIHRYRGGASSLVPTFCHTPLNFGIHFKEAPECFELQASGKRLENYPCYGNPKTVEIMIRDLENFYTKGDKRPWILPKKGYLWQAPTPYAYGISPPDKGVDCYCDYCKKLINRSAPRLERSSLLMAEFVKKMAIETKKKWPHLKVFYLPYSNYTLPPKGFRMPDNVVAGICLMHGTANAKRPEVARNHDAMMAGWHKITGNKVHLWEYLCWPATDTALPYQFPHVIQDFQRRHTDDLAGSFINGGGGHPDLIGGQWANQHPTLYCWFRLQWNPNFDVDAALKEYVELMYGPAREPMSEMLTHLTDRWEKSRWKKFPSTHRISPSMVNEETMPRKEALKLADMLARARKLAGQGSVYRRRVDFIGAAVDFFMEESNRYHGGAGTPTLAALKVGGNPVPDGKLDEAVWKDAERQPFKNARKVDPQVIPGKNGTTVQVVWTADGVTLGFRMDEPKIDKLVAKRTVRDQDVWWDDCIEMFLDVEGGRSSYYQIIFNSIGTTYDARMNDKSWHMKNAKVGAYKGKNFWSMEVFLPFAGLGGTPPMKPGVVWYVNFTRTRRTEEKIALQRWSTLYRASHLDFSAFGKLRFVE